MLPIPLELMLPVMPLSHPIATSALHGRSGALDCARAIEVVPSRTNGITTINRLRLVRLISLLLSHSEPHKRHALRIYSWRMSRPEEEERPLRQSPSVRTTPVT